MLISEFFKGEFDKAVQKNLEANISLEDVLFLPDYSSLSKCEIIEHSNGWTLNTPLKDLKSGEHKQGEVSETIKLEFKRLSIAIALQEAKLSSEGSNIIRSLYGQRDFPEWIIDAVAYYLPYRSLICNDINLLESMLVDIFDTSVIVRKASRSFFIKGPVLNRLLLGHSHKVGGEQTEPLQKLVCSFGPVPEQKCLNFFEGGGYYHVITKFLFPLFLDSQIQPEIEATLDGSKETLSRMNIGQKIGSNKSIIQ